MAKKSKAPRQVEAFKHDDASRKNIPTAEFQSVMAKEAQSPVQVAIERRNRDLDPQLVWRGKDEKDASGLVVAAPPIYIQEKVHPKVLIDDLRRETERRSQERAASEPDFIPDLFGDFNGVPTGADKTEFYQHDANWTNRMILGDSLQVMASLVEREGLRGKVQCIYIDPPYGIKFNSNFQWSTTSRDVKDGNVDHITREPEQVRAFRDTWRDGIHSYLSYLRDRLTIARELLTESGSIFVQIGLENVHRVRAVLDEVLGEHNSVSLITFAKTSSSTTTELPSTSDYILWYAKNKSAMKYRPATVEKRLSGAGGGEYRSVLLPNGDVRRLEDDEVLQPESLPGGARIFRLDTVTSQSPGTKYEVEVVGRSFYPSGYWKTEQPSMTRLVRASRIRGRANSLGYVRYFDDYGAVALSNTWADTQIAGRPGDKLYVVQTLPRVVQRCVLMATDPGDLVVDPTCGSGTTASVAEEWGRRWITIDTSRVALALARARIIGARYPYYLLADSPEGQQKEAEITRTPPKTTATGGNLRHGFVYERVPHVTLKSIANNTEIDVIWDRYQDTLEPLRADLTTKLPAGWLASFRMRQRYTADVPDDIQEWEIPREAPDGWSKPARDLHARFWEQRIARQREIDASIAARADTEYLYDRPYEDSKKVRVAGPFTVESLSPHRMLGVDENDELLDSLAETAPLHGDGKDFATVVLENLRTAGVQQAHKEDRITFTSLKEWPGTYICAEGRYTETREPERASAKASDNKGSVTERGGGAPRPAIKDGAPSSKERRAAIFIGPEFGTVSRPDLVSAAREAGDADFDVLIACAFNYDAHSADFDKLGRIPVLKARMNADLHMAGDLKNTGKGNLFVVFGEPDIEITHILSDGTTPWSCGKFLEVRIKGVDVFHPQTGEVRSDGPEGIACWFIDTDYNEESFFVRQAYFLGANDPYKSLKTTLKAEIDEDAWASLHSDTSRWFRPPTSGRIAVKVINHLGDEVMKVFRVE